MHYYQFHIGDYKSHTHHLTVIEDIAYRRLLDHYYLHESPIKQRDIARQIVMREHEQEVLSVLNEFFVSTEQGFINPRADAEIKNYREHQAKSAYGALVRDNPTFKSLVHMDKFIKCYLEKTHLEYVTSCTHHVPIKNPLTPLDATNNHKPITINQEPLTKREKTQDKPADLLFDEFWKAYPKKQGKDLAKTSFAKRKVGKELLQQMLSAIDQQKSTDQWKKDGGQFIPAPATWLNQGRWQDEITSVHQSTLPKCL